MTLHFSYAFSGGGRGIISVRISSDGGRSWYQAKLSPASPPAAEGDVTDIDNPHSLKNRSVKQWAWTIWTVEVPIPSKCLIMLTDVFVCLNFIVQRAVTVVRTVLGGNLCTQLLITTIIFVYFGS